MIYFLIFTIVFFINIYFAPPYLDIRSCGGVQRYRGLFIIVCFGFIQSFYFCIFKADKSIYLLKNIKKEQTKQKP
jgi:hypothetical protein